MGVAWNVTHYGIDYYRGRRGVLDRLAPSTSSSHVQVEHDQLVALLPMLERSRVRILIDHCGRPTPAAASTSRVFARCSGWPRPARVREALRRTRSSRASRCRTTTRGPSSTRCSARSRSIAACGRPIGRSCARRRASTTACCSRSRALVSRCRPTAQALVGDAARAVRLQAFYPAPSRGAASVGGCFILSAGGRRRDIGRALRRPRQARRCRPRARWRPARGSPRGW